MNKMHTKSSRIIVKFYRFFVSSNIYLFYDKEDKRIIQISWPKMHEKILKKKVNIFSEEKSDDESHLTQDSHFIQPTPTL